MAAIATVLKFLDQHVGTRRLKWRQALRAIGAIVAAMPLDPKQRHKLLMADRTCDATWIAAVVENLLAADPTVTLDEIEAALRDAAAHSYVVACPGKTFRVITGGMPEWRAALVEAGVTAAENRAALQDTHPAVLPK